MLYFLVTRDDNNKVTKAEVLPKDHSNTIDVEHRWDWNTFEAAKEVAAALGDGYLAIDKGEYVSPRYDVIDIPKVGADVSYTFNGDYYPCGQIRSISESLKVITTTNGKKFFRRRETGSWINNGTWSLIPGHHSKLNPEF